MRRLLVGGARLCPADCSFLLPNIRWDIDRGAKFLEIRQLEIEVDIVHSRNSQC